jgi:beta-glucosidase
MTIEEKVYQLGAYYFGSNIYSNANLRLGIPNLIAGESLNGFMGNGTTRFPQAIAMASTWDPGLIERMGHVAAKEARAYGVHQCYSPMVSVVRDIRWGRIEESYGEDPFLVAEIGVAYIKGLQGTGKERFDKNHILACTKHFVADGEPMAGDNGAAMDVSDYNLHNIHLYPFRKAIEEAQVSGIMPAHHLLNGIPCHVNKHIMIDILRNEYKWDGLVVSDNHDLTRLHNLFFYAKDPVDAALKSLEAGVHQELELAIKYDNRIYGQSLVAAIKNGQIPIKLIDEAVAANLRAKYALGLFEAEKPSKNMFMEEEEAPPVYFTDHFSRYRGIDTEKYNSIRNYHETNRINKNISADKSHDALALEVAQKAIILLKNDNNILPLNIEKLNKIAVIGPNADAVRFGGYSRGEAKYFVTILEGIKKYVGGKAEVTYEEGTGIDTDKPRDYSDIQFDLELTRQAEDRRSDTSTPESEKILKAVELAENSDVVILAMGGSEATCRENEDTDYLGLRGRQMELVKAVHATGKPCVVVLLGGRPLAITWIRENIPGIIQGWYLGQETGTAIADVLFGKINPGGKLPVTVARNVGQVPLFYNKLETGRPRRIYRSSPEPLFEFGYGLSYTTFKLDNLKLMKNQIIPDEKTSLSIDITNTGKMAGEEVVQLYIRAWSTERVRPQKELRGFQRVYLEPGQTKTLNFEIGKKQLEYWNEKWLVESGKYTLFIATDSSDEKLKKNNLELNVK